MKLAILGSSTFNDYEYFKTRLDKLLSKKKNETIIIYCIEQKGVTELTRKYIEENNIESNDKKKTLELIVYPINWDKYGKMAAYTAISKVSSKCTHGIIYDNHDTKTNIKAIEDILMDDKIEYVTFKTILKKDKDKNE